MSHKVERQTRLCLECGQSFEFLASPSKIASGRGKYCSKSCGNRATSRRHGHTTNTGQSRTYNSWATMLGRCTNPKHPKFASYGASGVAVCERWMKFEQFLADMGERPEGKTLDRIDPFGNYEPKNCRWATPAEQQLNLRKTRRYPFRGQELTIKEIATATGLMWWTVQYRVKQGWTDEQIASPASSVPVAFRNIA